MPTHWDAQSRLPGLPGPSSRKVAGFGAHRQAVLLGLDRDSPEAVVLHRIRRVIRELVRGPKFFRNLPEVFPRVGQLRVDVSPPGFLGDALHDADAILVARRQLSVLL